MSRSKVHYVLVSPHIDDVAFSLGAALLSNRFSPSVVLNVFSVSRCTVDDRECDLRRVTTIRKAEDAAFFDALQKPIRLAYFDRLDAPIRLGINEEDVCRVAPAASDGREMNALRGAIEALLLDDTILVAPLGLGRHVDHVLIHRVACVLARRGCPTAFYEDLPYAGRLQLSEIERTVSRTSSMVGRTFRPLLISAMLTAGAKTEALASYSSQREAGTIAAILRHGERLGGSVIAERIWGDHSALARIATRQ